MVLGTRYKLQDAQFLNLIIDNHDVKHVSKITGRAYWWQIIFYKPYL